MPMKPPVFRAPSVGPCVQTTVKRKHDAQAYDQPWRRLRKAFLAANGTCCVVGCGLRATDVDHVQSVRERPDLRLTWANLRPFCHAHHSQRTALEQGFASPTARLAP